MPPAGQATGVELAAYAKPSHLLHHFQEFWPGAAVFWPARWGGVVESKPIIGAVAMVLQTARGAGTGEPLRNDRPGHLLHHRRPCCPSNPGSLIASL
jgi:hypothetical protein